MQCDFVTLNKALGKLILPFLAKAAIIYVRSCCMHLIIKSFWKLRCLAWEVFLGQIKHILREEQDGGVRGNGVLSPESQCRLHAVGVCCKEENGRNKE